MEQAQLQLQREPLSPPQLFIARKPASLFEYAFDDFVFENYQCHPAIKAPVAV